MKYKGQSSVEKNIKQKKCLIIITRNYNFKIKLYRKFFDEKWIKGKYQVVVKNQF